MDNLQILVAVHHKILMNQYSHNSGFVAFTSILVISAVVLAIATSISLIGIGSVKSALSGKKGQEALKVAESCVEEGLLRLRDDGNYVGGTLNVGDGFCTISVGGSGVDRTIDAAGSLVGPPSFTKRIRVTLKKAGNSVNITGWQEIE